MAVLRVDGSDGDGLMIEGVAAFASYLFDHFDLRKIYFEVPAYNAELFSVRGTGLLREEGRFVDHFYYGGRFWDLHTFAMHRSDWEAAVGGFFGPREGT
ncbi:MAG: GNAT family protein [Acidimicrobiales bacterium]